jgi:hypothetical protein
MSSKKSLLFVSLPVLAALIYWGTHFEKVQKEAPDLDKTSASVPLQAQAAVAPAPQTSPAIKHIGSPDISKDQVARPPSVSTLREEVKRDVHVTPPSLLRFAVDMGVRMKAAKANKADAVALLGELKTCAQPAQLDESPVQARAICLIKARELAQAWPDLNGEAEELITHSDPKALQLASEMGTLKRTPTGKGP